MEKVENLETSDDALKGFGNNPRNDHVYVYRYLLKLRTAFGEENERLALKVVSETYEGHLCFVDSLIKDENVLAVGREYVCEMDCSLVGIFENVKSSSASVAEELKEELK